MAAAAPTRPAISDADLPALLDLIGGADTVELKLTVPESDQRSAIEALGLDPIDAQIRQVFFFDTPNLALNQAGLVVRARRLQRKGDDTVVKLRPVVPAELPKKVRRAPGFGVEVDAMPGGFVCSASFMGVADTGRVKEVAGRQRRLSKLFSKDQRAFDAAHAPAGVELDGLVLLGPIFVLKLKFSPGGFARKLVAERWLYPDESRILELSTKCAPPEAFEVAAALCAFLSERGIDLSGEQAPKTKRALEFFTARMRERAA